MSYKLNFKTSIVIGSVVLILLVVSLFVFSTDKPKPESASVNTALEEMLGISTIVLNNNPAIVQASTTMTIAWEINSQPKTINHTAVFWDFNSHPGDLDFTVTPSEAGYEYMTNEFASGEFLIPRDFTARIFVPAESKQIFYRVHTVIDGKHYWSSEQEVTVIDAAEISQSETDIDIEIEATDEQPESVSEALPDILEEPEPVIVNYSDTGFEPVENIIKLGDTVRFINNSSRPFWPASNDHPTHRLYPGTNNADCDESYASEMFDACSPIASGQYYEFTFFQIGEWMYHDHLQAGFVGKIVVQ